MFYCSEIPKNTLLEHMFSVRPRILVRIGFVSSKSIWSCMKSVSIELNQKSYMHFWLWNSSPSSKCGYSPRMRHCDSDFLDFSYFCCTLAAREVKGALDPGNPSILKKLTYNKITKNIDYIKNMIEIYSYLLWSIK